MTVSNIAFTLSLCSIGYGCWLLHPALMYIVCGSIIAGFVIYARVKGIG